MNRKDIVKKALKNTVKEILVDIMMVVSFLGFIGGVLYVFYRLPYWVLGLIGKSEILSEYSDREIYCIEFAILFFVFLIGGYVYVRFSDNLYDLEKAESECVQIMSCDILGRCGCCSKNDNCPYEHYGDGSPFCGEFQCIIKDCKRTICITDEELMDI